MEFTYGEWQVVKYDLMFPHLFFGAMSKYYYQREQTFTMAKYMQRIQEMADTERTMISVFGDFEAILKCI